jgi:hypothetical protein
MNFLGGLERIELRGSTRWRFGANLRPMKPKTSKQTQEPNDPRDAPARASSKPRRDGAGTRLVVHDRYPSKEALDAAVASGATSWNSETFDQLDELLVKLDTSTRG